MALYTPAIQAILLAVVDIGQIMTFRYLMYRKLRQGIWIPRCCTATLSAPIASNGPVLKNECYIVHKHGEGHKWK